MSERLIAAPDEAVRALAEALRHRQRTRGMDRLSLRSKILVTLTLTSVLSLLLFGSLAHG